jgi:hypothetical protein
MFISSISQPAQDHAGYVLFKGAQGYSGLREGE